MMLKPFGFNRKEVAAGGSWVPSDHADYSTVVHAWYDASDATTITDTAGEVTALADKTSNGFTLAVTSGGAEPTTGANTVNSLNALYFGGTGDALRCNDIGTTIDTFFCIVVFRAMNGSQLHGGVFAVDVNGATPHVTLVADWPATLDISVLFGNGNADGNQTLTDNQVYLASVEHPGSSTQGTTLIEVDATALSPTYSASGTTSSIPAGTRRLTVGNMSAGGSSSEMDFCELLLLKALPSVDFRDRIEGYLAHRWGTQGSLPGGHTYKSSAP